MYWCQRFKRGHCSGVITQFSIIDYNQKEGVLPVSGILLSRLQFDPNKPFLRISQDYFEALKQRQNPGKSGVFRFNGLHEIARPCPRKVTT